MIVKLEINATKEQVQCAADVIANIYNGRNCMRQADVNSGRVATEHENESFAGLALASTIIKRANEEAQNAV